MLLTTEPLSQSPKKVVAMFSVVLSASDKVTIHSKRTGNILDKQIHQNSYPESGARVSTCSTAAA